MHNVRFLLLMRHAKHTHGRAKPPKQRGEGPLHYIADSLHALAHKSVPKRARGQDSPPDGDAQTASSVLSDAGKEETESVANRLKEMVLEGSENLELVGVLVSGAPEAKETAHTFCKAFGFVWQDKLIEVPLLTPKTAYRTQWLQNGDVRTFAEKLKDQVAHKSCELVSSREPYKAILVVGHQPALSWLAYELVGEAHPIANSEVLCLELKENASRMLSWSISPTDDATLNELREKIKSKMALANILSGFITAGVGVLVAMLADKAKIDALGVQRPMLFLAAGCLLMAVILYLLTMFSYDSLLMPRRFWTETPSGTSARPPWVVARPPSAAHWILYQNMIRVWQWQFMPATFLTLSGLFMLWSGVFWGTWEMSHSPKAMWSAVSRLLTLSVPLVAIVIVIGIKARAIVRGVRRGWDHFRKCPGPASMFRYVCGPWLGSED